MVGIKIPSSNVWLMLQARVNKNAVLAILVYQKQAVVLSVPETDHCIVW